MTSPRQIEQTAKKYKAIQVAGVLLMTVGLVILVVSFASAPGDGHARPNTWPVLIILGGIIVYIHGRVAAWWHHG